MKIVKEHCKGIRIGNRISLRFRKHDCFWMKIFSVWLIPSLLLFYVKYEQLSISLHFLIWDVEIIIWAKGVWK